MASICSVLMTVLLMTVQGWTRAAPVDTTDNVGVFYDQRQSGEYNIHVIVKDVGIVALLGDSLGDYEYDYSYDYQVPQKPLGSSTTAEPTSSVAAQNSSSSSAAAATTASSSTIITPGTLTESASNASYSSVSPSDLTSTTSVESTTSTEDRTISTTTSVSNIAECSISTKGDECNQQKQENGKRPGKGRRRCNAGYIRDNHGRCRRLRRPGQQNTGLELPFGLRLFPKLVAPLHTENA